MIRHRSLFSGIEGFGLGFALAGLSVETVEAVEIDPFAQQILRARLPNARIVSDVREVGKASPPADWLTAGFPCQPVSQAGKGLAQKDERWLWPETARIIAETKPALVFLENVRGLLAAGRGMGDLLRDLAEIGYGAQWDLIPALAVGAPHLRHRVFVVAYPEAKPLGHVFDRPPWIFPWPADPAERRDDARVPRLIRNVPNRKERLTRLGNAVVPQVVASVAIQAIAAMSAEPISPPRLIPDPWPDAFPKAGALVAGHVFALPTSVAKAARAKVPSRTLGAIRDGDVLVWPTPAASIPNESETVEGWEERGLKQRALGNRPISPPLSIAVRGAEDGLWPTPKAADGDNSSEQGPRFYAGKGDNPTLLGAARSVEGVSSIAPDDPRRWPTPIASDARSASRRDADGNRYGNSGDTLRDAVLDREAETVWPTPSASDGSGGRVSSAEVRATGRRPSGTKAQRTLGDAAVEAEEGHVWPTPSARDSKGPSGAGFLERREGSPDLAAAVEEQERLWPTPKAAPSGPDYARINREGSGGDDLATAVAREETGRTREAETLWQTPTAAPWSHGGGGGELVSQIKAEQGEETGGWSRAGASPDDPGRSLNPRWVEWLMGYPDGWTDPENASLTLNEGDPR